MRMLPRLDGRPALAWRKSIYMDDTPGKRAYAEYEGAGKEAGLLPLVENLRVLEVGFGSGALLEALRGKGNAVYGVDAGRAIVEKAKRAGFENVFLVDASEEPLPFEDDFFDAVYCYEVLEHLTNPHRLVQEIRRVLRKQGLLFFSVPAQEIDMGYGLLRHTFVYPGLLERPNLERFFMQMYFRIEESIHPSSNQWLMGHNYVFRNIKPEGRKDVVEVIIGDYSVHELYHDVLSLEKLAEETARELSFYDRMLTDYIQNSAWDGAMSILTFLIGHYPCEYDFFLRWAESFRRGKRLQEMKWLLEQVLAASTPPVSVMEGIAEILRSATGSMGDSSGPGQE